MERGLGRGSRSQFGQFIGAFDFELQQKKDDLEGSGSRGQLVDRIRIKQQLTPRASERK